MAAREPVRGQCQRRDMTIHCALEGQGKTTLSAIRFMGPEEQVGEMMQQQAEAAPAGSSVSLTG